MADNQTNTNIMQDMTKEDTLKREMNEEAKEKIYQKILELDKSVKCIEQYELFAFVYKNIIQKAKRLEGYKDSDAYQEKYEKKLDKLQKVTREEIYQKVLEYKENVTKAEDLQWIRKEIHRIPDYKDVDEIARWCDAMQEKMERREKRNAWIRVFVIILVVCIIVMAIKYL